MASAHRRLRHPYHLKRLYSSWRLRVLKHEHTGRRVHHQHTSYPLLAMLVLVAGLLMVPASSVALADTLTVSAVVAGPVPTTPATIDTPTDGATITTTPLSVSGTCQLNTYVQLFRNNYTSGTALCTSGGTYTIQTSLFDGANALIVRTYNFDNQPGPDSSTTTVTYSPPVTPPPIQGTGGGSTSGSTGSTGSSGTSGSSGASHTGGSGTTTLRQPLTLKNDFTFQGFDIGENATWQIAISGGTAPYSVNVNWGDGQTALYTSTAADTLTLSHVYAKPGPNNGSYPVLVTASDTAGTQATLQIMALINALPGPTTTGSSAGSHGGGSSDSGASIFGVPIKQAVGYVWTTYGGVSVALFSFWLGELRQLRVIRARFNLTKL